MQKGLAEKMKSNYSLKCTVTGQKAAIRSFKNPADCSTGIGAGRGFRIFILGDFPNWIGQGLDQPDVALNLSLL